MRTTGPYVSWSSAQTLPDTARIQQFYLGPEGSKRLDRRRTTLP